MSGLTLMTRNMWTQTEEGFTRQLMLLMHRTRVTAFLSMSISMNLVLYVRSSYINLIDV